MAGVSAGARPTQTPSSDWPSRTRSNSRLAERLRSAIGFRTVFVHQYAEVDDDRAVVALEDLDDFDAYLAQLARWTTSQPGNWGGADHRLAVR